jgi:hypothetical protein
MSGFVQALDSYRNGTLSRDELLAEIERQLASGESLKRKLASPDLKGLPAKDAVHILTCIASGRG